MGKRSEAGARVMVRKLPYCVTSPEGRFYAVLDGKKVAERGRLYWHTKPDAFRCGVRFLTARLASERRSR